ncbi:MAG TPA: M13 family metallopeptidase [Thermoanaerobaculia bacterium]
MSRTLRLLPAVLLLAALPLAAQAPQASSEVPLPPYTPSLDVTAMDRTVDPCVDFYAYSCGGWMKTHPIPSDQVRWDVYDKMFDDNSAMLQKVLEAAAKPDPKRNQVDREIGDLYASCMDQATIDKAGVAPIQGDLDAIAHIASLADLADVVVVQHMEVGTSALFRFGSQQDYKDSSQVIASVGQGGLGLPDRDYYLKEDAKSVETRQKYVAHLQKTFELLGDAPGAAAANAATVMAIETALAKSSLTRVERRDPSRIYHRMTVEDLAALAPSFPWRRYFERSGLPGLKDLNVATPDFFKGLEALLKPDGLERWKPYLRVHAVTAVSRNLATPFEAENFDFYSRILRGQQEMQPRAKRCVRAVNGNLGEALGQSYVARAFSPELKARTQTMVQQIEKAMEADIHSLDWMSQTTKEQALGKLHAVANKIGYPDHWRDYSSIKIARDDFAGNLRRANLFESRRDVAKIGKPVERDEWGMTPPTVNAFYRPSLNDINFPAGILQPPLYDPKMDDAPNYGDTGSTIGHELTHGFDDQGRRFDAVGNLRDWWTAADGKEFEKRAACISDQYSQYVIVDDVKINGTLTLGEDVADLGGTMLAWRAWKEATRGQKLESKDGLTPEQRFFVGYGQSWCSIERPEDMRVRAATDPHSPAKYRANGVVVNMPEFRQAFSCKVGQPMAPEKTCRVW